MLALNIQLLVAGLTVGSIYALVALGLVMTYKASDVLNFAQGEIVTAGAYIALLLSVTMKFPYYQSFFLTIILVAGLGILLERVAFRPLIKAPAFTIIIATLAVGQMIKNLIRLIWQSDVHRLPPPFKMAIWKWQDIRVNAQAVWVIICALLITGILAIFFRSSWLGKAMRSVSQNQEGARLMGISVERAFSLTWAISAAMGAAAGILIAPLTGVYPDMGLVLVKAFVASIIGGFTSLIGAVVGGILVGLIETFSGAYISSTFKEFVAFILLIVLLMFRPYGLFGSKQARRV
jgi:branched-chain amino acid transport system permease protein